MDQPLEAEPQQPSTCPTCKTIVPSSNFNIHQTQCAAKAMRRKKYAEKKAREKQLKREKDEKVKSSKRQSKQKEKKEEQERFPCHLCSYQQTMAQLDTHFKNCPNREITCPYCEENFPTNIMAEHRAICSARIARQQPIPPPPPRRPPQNTSNRQVEEVWPRQNTFAANSTNSERSIMFSRSPSIINEAAQRVGQICHRTRQRPLPHQLLNRPPFQRSQAERQNPFNLRPPQTSHLSQTRSNTTNSSNESTHSDQIGSANSTSRRARNMQNSLFTTIPRYGVDMQRLHGGMMNMNFQPVSMRSITATHFRRLNQILFDQIRTTAQRQDQANLGGLTDAQIDRIPNKVYKQQKQEKDTCCICYCDFELMEQVKDLKCQHLFHVKCIQQWLKKNKLCPLCKTNTINSIIQPQSKVQQSMKPEMRQIQRSRTLRPAMQVGDQRENVSNRHWSNWFEDDSDQLDDVIRYDQSDDQ